MEIEGGKLGAADYRLRGMMRPPDRDGTMSIIGNVPFGPRRGQPG